MARAAEESEHRAMNAILLTWYFQATPLACCLGAAVLGGLTGISSILLYAKVSPQSRLADLGKQASEARLALNRFDGEDLREVLSLSWHAVKLSLRQMGLILGPTLLAGAVVLGVAWLAEFAFPLSQVRFGPSYLPAWLCGGYAAFWIPLTVGAVGSKWLLKIK
jgi:hypothetical protein